MCESKDGDSVQKSKYTRHMPTLYARYLAQHTCARGETPDHQVPSCFSNTLPSSRHPCIRSLPYHLLNLFESSSKLLNWRPHCRRASRSNWYCLTRLDHRFDEPSSRSMSMSSMTNAAILPCTQRRYCYRHSRMVGICACRELLLVVRLQSLDDVYYCWFISYVTKRCKWHKTNLNSVCQCISTTTSNLPITSQRTDTCLGSRQRTSWRLDHPYCAPLWPLSDHQNLSSVRPQCRQWPFLHRTRLHSRADSLPSLVGPERGRSIYLETSRWKISMWIVWNQVLCTNQ